MDKLIEVLNDIDDSIDYENEVALIDDHLLDSFGIISLVGELEDVFDISIGAEEMTAENFNNVESLWKMIQRLQKET